jgi:tetrahydromethanopterin S-methyltransferase subunit G
MDRNIDQLAQSNFQEQGAYGTYLLILQNLIEGEKNTTVQEQKIQDKKILKQQEIQDVKNKIDDLKEKMNLINSELNNVGSNVEQLSKQRMLRIWLAVAFAIIVSLLFQSLPATVILTALFFFLFVYKKW